MRQTAYEQHDVDDRHGSFHLFLDEVFYEQAWNYWTHRLLNPPILLNHDALKSNALGSHL